MKCSGGAGGTAGGGAGGTAERIDARGTGGAGGMATAIDGASRARIEEYAKKFGCEYVAGRRPWGIKCDAVFPSATQNEISGDDAAILLKNGCKLIAEGANMPSTPEAIDRFLKAKVLYGPGKAANAGGVATSGLEMSQNSQRLAWTRECRSPNITNWFKHSYLMVFTNLSA